MDRVFESAMPLPPSPSGDSNTSGQEGTQGSNRGAVLEPIDVEVRDSRRGGRHWQQQALIAAGGLACLSLLGSVLLWRGWTEARQDLRQERNLRLLEGIRSLGSPAATPPAGGGDGLPPPPPAGATEPWIQELGELEARSAAAVAPLQVPLNGTLQAPAPAASSTEPSTTATAPSASAPELLGVVQIPGKPGSAIFQVGGGSTNALVGESIGSSGWRLVSANGDSAVIERGGVSRRVSISSGF